MVQRVRRLQNEGEGGFTLIELLIVIVVLGILAGIVVLGLGTFKQDAEDAACLADLKQVQTATDAYMAGPSTGPLAPANVAALVAAGLLKSAPAASSGAYTIAANGDVVSDACAP
jgi:prepilin-type N-terminal cleavage/methylation domain-containing protein